jgi:hypothetical protein
LGAAGQPYTRTVAPLTPKSPYLPDPELVFDQLLRRRGFTEHAGGLNRLFFSFATVVIHVSCMPPEISPSLTSLCSKECFQSDYQKPWINNTSSYVDLSTIYGNNQEEQDKVRTFKQGLLYPDTLASDRIFQMPPGVIALLIMFSRHHNYLANRLLDVNETGKYKAWDDLDEEGRKWQDNDIFQLTRNINVAFFAKVSFGSFCNRPQASLTSNLTLTLKGRLMRLCQCDIEHYPKWE